MTDHQTSEDGKPATKQMVVAAAVQLAFTLVAYMVLKRTPDDRLRGPRRLWRLVIPASVMQVRGPDVVLAPVGPVLFFAVGRRRAR